MLETALPSSSTLAAIYSFVRDSLSERCRTQRFTLCPSSYRSQRPADRVDQSPPRRDYAEADPKLRGQTLHDLQFVPSTVLSIRFDRDELNGASARRRRC